MKKTPLSIRPVRRYRRPKYPSWQDQNPLEFPEMVPYPFRKKVWHALAASGIASSLVFAGSQCTEGKPVQQFGIHPDSLYNPFPFEQMGLPYHSPFFGTGQPERMREKEVRAIFEKIVAEHGLHLQPDYLFRSGEHTILLNGFDPEHKIGYVFVSGERLDRDGFVRRYSGDQPNSIRYMDAAFDYLAGAGDWQEPLSTDLKRELNRIKQEQDSLISLDLVHQAVKEDFIRGYTEKDLPDWLQKRVKAALRLAEPNERKQAIDQCVLAIDLIYFNIFDGLPDLLQAQRHVAAALFRPGKSPVTSTAVQKVMAIFRYLYYFNSQSKYPDSDVLKAAAAAKRAGILQALTATGDALDQNIESLMLESDAFFISLSDIQTLDSLAQRGELFVAPLSQYSTDLGYYYDGDAFFATLERQLQETKDSAEIKQLEERMHNFKSVRIKELEKNMHRYLLWARSQGKY